MSHPHDSDESILRLAMSSLEDNVERVEGRSRRSLPTRDPVALRRPVVGGRRRSEAARIEEPPTSDEPVGGGHRSAASVDAIDGTAAVAPVSGGSDRGDVAALSHRVAELLAERESLQRRLAEGADDVDEREALLAAQTRRVTALEAERASLVRRLGDGADEVDVLRQRIEHLQGAVEQSQRRLEAQGQDLARARHDLGERERDLEEIADDLVEAARRAERAERENADLRRRDAEHVADVAREAAEHTAARETIGDLEARIGSLLRTLSDREERLDLAARAADDLAIARSSIQDYQAEAEALCEQVVALQDALVAAEDRHAAEITAVVAEFSSLRP